MTGVTTLYDDLVAIRHAAAALDVDASKETRGDLKVLENRIEGKLTLAFSWPDEDEYEEIAEGLDDDYDNQAREDLERLRKGVRPLECRMGRPFWGYNADMAMDKDGNHVVSPPGGKVELETFPAKVSGSGVVSSAAKATIAALSESTPHVGISGDDVKEFLRRAKSLDERLVRIAMRSPDRCFASIGLDRGPLSENDARVALEQYFEKRAGRRSFWGGFVSGIMSSVITALLVAWLLSILGPVT